jgi:hypothetical protein
VVNSNIAIDSLPDIEGGLKANPNWPLLADVCVILQNLKDLDPDLTEKSCSWLSKIFQILVTFYLDYTVGCGGQSHCSRPAQAEVPQPAQRKEFPWDLK